MKLIISDLHLTERHPATFELFTKFIKEQATQAESLYILGDLFDFWVGDDDLTSFNLKVIKLLQSLSQNCIPVFIMRGNRDFLIGSRFARTCGAKLLHDPHVLQLDSKKLVLTHGDILCTDDRAYQRFRRVIQSKLMRLIAGILPLNWRRKIAIKLRQKTRKPGAEANYGDVNQTAVQAMLAKYNCKLMIHGHTHRFAEHNYENGAKRYVLGDWHPGTGSFIAIEGDEINLNKMRGNPAC